MVCVCGARVDGMVRQHYVHVSVHMWMDEAGDGEATQYVVVVHSLFPSLPVFGF